MVIPRICRREGVNKAKRRRLKNDGMKIVGVEEEREGKLIFEIEKIQNYNQGI